MSQLLSAVINGDYDVVKILLNDEKVDINEYGVNFYFI